MRGAALDPELQKHVKTLTKLAILVLALVSIYLLFSFVLPIAGKILAYIPILFLPFILAVLLAVIVEPIVNWFEKRARMKRSWAVALSLLLVVGGFIYIISLIISIIIWELSRLYPRVAQYSDQVVSRVLEAVNDIQILYLKLNLPPEVALSLQQNLGKGLETMRGLIDSSINILVQVLAALPGVFIFLIIAAVATFLIVKDRALIREFIFRFLPSSAQSKTAEIIGNLFQALIGFLKAYSILITITAIITMISLRILGVEYILTIGIIIGLCDILPVLGPGTIFVPWVIWELISGNTRLGIGLLIVYVIISVVRQVLEPKIVGDNIGLHPLITLISLYVGLQLGGVIGMVLGPVLVVIIIACYRAGLFKGMEWGKPK